MSKTKDQAKTADERDCIEALKLMEEDWNKYRTTRPKKRRRKSTRRSGETASLEEDCAVSESEFLRGVFVATILDLRARHRNLPAD